MKKYFVMAHDTARQLAQEAVKNAPQGYIVEIKEPTRTLEQNALLWSLLHELSDQIVWHGMKLSAENWKDMCTAALKKQQVVPGIDGGFVVLGQSTSKMTKSEMSDLIEFIHAFGAEHGVEFYETV